MSLWCRRLRWAGRVTRKYACLYLHLLFYLYLSIFVFVFNKGEGAVQETKVG